MTILADEVDHLVEFVDTNSAAVTTPATCEPAGARRPIYTDVVDRVVEFTEGTGNETSSERGNERPPVFVDTVDHVVEFADEPDQNAVMSQVTAVFGVEKGIR